MPPQNETPVLFGPGLGWERSRAGAAPQLPLSPAESLAGLPPPLSALLARVPAADGEAESGIAPKSCLPLQGGVQQPPGCPRTRHGSGVRGIKLCAKPTLPFLSGFSKWSEGTEIPPERSSPSALRLGPDPGQSIRPVLESLLPASGSSRGWRLHPCRSVSVTLHTVLQWHCQLRHRGSGTASSGTMQ